MTELHSDTENMMAILLLHRRPGISLLRAFYSSNKHFPPGKSVHTKLMSLDINKYTPNHHEQICSLQPKVVSVPQSFWSSNLSSTNYQISCSSQTKLPIDNIATNSSLILKFSYQPHTIKGTKRHNTEQWHDVTKN